MTDKELKAVVDATATKLDSVRPGWEFKFINCTLDMEDPEYCLAAQLERKSFYHCDELFRELGFIPPTGNRAEVNRQRLRWAAENGLVADTPPGRFYELRHSWNSNRLRKLWIAQDRKRRFGS